MDMKGSVRDLRGSEVVGSLRTEVPITLKRLKEISHNVNFLRLCEDTLMSNIWASF